MFALIPNYVTHELAKDEGKHLFTLWIWSGTLVLLAGFLVAIVMPVDYTFLVGRYNGLMEIRMVLDPLQLFSLL